MYQNTIKPVPAGLDTDEGDFSDKAYESAPEAEEPTREQMRAQALLDNEFDPSLFDDCGVYDPTIIAEYLSWNYGKDSWLDDESHWIWELAGDLAEMWNEARWDDQDADEDEEE